MSTPQKCHEYWMLNCGYALWGCSCHHPRIFIHNRIHWCIRNETNHRHSIDECETIKFRRSFLAHFSITYANWKCVYIQMDVFYPYIYWKWGKKVVKRLSLRHTVCVVCRAISFHSVIKHWYPSTLSLPFFLSLRLYFICYMCVHT